MERELRRKKQFQHNQEKKSVKKLWSVPQPEEYTFDARGYKKLFHYTSGDNIYSILKYGIILGGISVSYREQFNAPCLTTENEFHNPSLLPEKELGQMRNGYYRLTIKCPTDADKLINHGWFDKTYSNNLIRGINSKNIGTGNVDNQYFYLGHIIPSMIKEIKVWNSKIQYWDRPTKKEINDLCSEYENLPYLRKIIYDLDTKRLIGVYSNDYTGEIAQFYAENDHKDIWKDVYILSDYLNEIFKSGHIKNKYAKQIEEYKSIILKYFKRKSTITELIVGVVLTFNEFVSKSEKINPTDFINSLNKKFMMFENWLEEKNEEVELKLVA